MRRPVLLAVLLALISSSNVGAQVAAPELATPQQLTDRFPWNPASGRPGDPLEVLGAVGDTLLEGYEARNARFFENLDFIENHLDPSGELRPDLWLEGVQHTLSMGFSTAMLGHGGSVTGAQWTQIGPGPVRIDTDQVFMGNGPVAGEVLDIAIDPRGASDQRIYVATNDGGIWRSLNGGASWTPRTDYLPSLSMGAVELDPGNPDIVYAGSGNNYDGSGGAGSSTGFSKAAGLYRSPDRGLTWTVLDPGNIFTSPQRGINRMVLPAPNTLLVATNNGLYRSVDGGTSFGNNAPDFDDGDPIITGNITDVDLDTGDPTRVYASRTGTGILVSTDSGQTFPLSSNLFTATNGGPTAGLGFIRMAQSTNPDTTQMYATVGGWTGFYSSTDSGGTWTRRASADAAAADNGGCQCGYDQTIGVDPQDGNRVYIGFQELYLSTDGGATGFSVPAISRNLTHWDHHAITFSPSTHWGGGGAPTRTYTGTDGGLHRSDDGGTSWTDLNEGVSTILFKQIDMGRGSSANNAYTYGGTQDNGTLHDRAAFPGNDWHLGQNGDGGPVAVDPTDPTHVYSHRNGRMKVSTNAGNTWSNTTAQPTNGVWRIAIDPNDVDTVWAGEAVGIGFSGNADLWRSTDATATMSEEVTFTSNIRTIVPYKGNSDLLWVGLTGGKVAKSTNATAANPTFTEYQLPNTTGRVDGVAIDPSDPQRVVVAVGGFSGIAPTNPTRHVYLTTTGGTSWTDISGTVGQPGTNLPDLPTHSVVIDPGPAPHGIIVSNEAAVFRSLDNGATWQRLGLGLPTVDARKLVIDDEATPPVLRVGTYGRSTFELTPATGPLLVVEGDLAFGDVKVTETKDKNLTLKNVGSSNLNVTSFERLSGSAEFSIVGGPARPFTIAPGGQETMAVRFDPNDEGGPANATFRLETNDQFQPIRDYEATGEGIPQADMELVFKTDSADPAIAGTQLTYTVRARNNGPSTAQNARVVDVLPAGVSHVSNTGGCVEGPAGTLTCGFGAMAPGAQETFTITVAIGADLVHNNGSPLTITNTATASSDTEDHVPGNNAETEDTLLKAEADLEIVSFDPVDPPTELTIGDDPMLVTLRKVITNNGPSAPMDTRVARGAGATANATVSPSFTSHVEAALGGGEERVVDEVFEVACIAPGPATFTFANDISPDRPDDTDPDLSNNSMGTSFSVECIVPVAINIHPGSSKNPINLGSQGDTTVAVLTTLAGEYDLPLDFDATAIQALTARFGPEGLVISGGGAHEDHDQGHVEDAIERSDEKTKDGDLDMVLHFRTQESGLTGTEVEACVRGRFGPMDYVFHGCDVVALKL